MEMEDLHSSKRFCLQNGSGAAGGTADMGRAATAKVRQQERLPEEEEDGEVKYRLGRKVKAMADAAALALHPWLQPPGASRICRVSRASGGKDRHSKVLTAKGLRDRRVRLSVSTAIQFYDLQDRLGYDQPSKAVEWLIKAAAEAISDLPSLNAAFTDQPPSRSQPREEERPFPTAEDGGDAEVAQLEDTDRRQRQEQHQQHISLTKSACSSTSETSKCSVLSLSRSEIRNKARERARERTATAKEKEKDKDGDDDADYASVAHHQVLNLNPPPQSSFIELLTGGGQQNQNHHQGPVTVAQENPLPDFIPKQLRHMPASATFVKSDFFGHVGLFGEGEKPHQPPGFPTQTHINVATATALATGDHPEIQQPQQQFSFMPEHLIPLAATAAGGDYINFSVASGFAGFNRGTLQSNFASPQPNHHLQRLSSPVDGSNLPFFLSSSSQAASASWDGPLAAGFDGRLQRCFDGYRHSDLKGSGKS